MVALDPTWTSSAVKCVRILRTADVGLDCISCSICFIVHHVLCLSVCISLSLSLCLHHPTCTLHTITTFKISHSAQAGLNGNGQKYGNNNNPLYTDLRNKRLNTNPKCCHLNHMDLFQLVWQIGWEISPSTFAQDIFFPLPLVLHHINVRQELSCSDGRTLLHKSNFRRWVGIPLVNALFFSNLWECYHKNNILLKTIFVTDSVGLVALTWFAWSNYAITPLKVAQGHQFRYQSKASMPCNNNLLLVLYRFRDAA